MIKSGGDERLVVIGLVSTNLTWISMGVVGSKLVFMFEGKVTLMLVLVVFRLTVPPVLLVT